MINKIWLSIIVLASLSLNSQNLNGTYSCLETSFRDMANEKNNFYEKCNMKVVICYKSNSIKTNFISISDLEVPKTNYKYKIQKPIETMPASSFYVSCYLFKDCLNEKTNSLCDITIYINRHYEMNLMISNSDKSQVLKDLILQLVN